MISVAGRLCLVTGASGFVGGWVVEKLIAEGARVRCLVRSSSRLDLLQELPVELAVGDVADLSALRSALSGVEFVFHVAGLIKANDPSDYFRVNSLGSVNVLEAARSQAPQLERLVLVSSLAAAGPSQPGRPRDETHPALPLTPYGQSKWQSEEAAASYRTDLPITIVRPPTVYGPRDRESLILFRVVAAGIRPKLGDDSEVSLVHVSDLVDGILLAATTESAVGQTYFIAGDETPSLSKLVEYVADAVGRPGIEVPVAEWSIRTAGKAADFLRQNAGLPIIFDRWKAEELLAGYWACSNAKAKAGLHFAPRISLREGLLLTSRWYREVGWL